MLKYNSASACSPVSPSLFYFIQCDGISPVIGRVMNSFFTYVSTSFDPFTADPSSWSLAVVPPLVLHHLHRAFSLPIHSCLLFLRDSAEVGHSEATDDDVLKEEGVNVVTNPEPAAPSNEKYNQLMQLLPAEMQDLVQVNMSHLQATGGTGAPSTSDGQQVLRLRAASATFDQLSMEQMSLLNEAWNLVFGDEEGSVEANPEALFTYRDDGLLPDEEEWFMQQMLIDNESQTRRGGLQMRRGRKAPTQKRKGNGGVKGIFDMFFGHSLICIPPITDLISRYCHHTEVCSGVLYIYIYIYIFNYFMDLNIGRDRTPGSSRFRTSHSTADQQVQDDAGFSGGGRQQGWNPLVPRSSPTDSQPPLGPSKGRGVSRCTTTKNTFAPGAFRPSRRPIGRKPMDDWFRMEDVSIGNGTKGAPRSSESEEKVIALPFYTTRRGDPTEFQNTLSRRNEAEQSNVKPPLTFTEPIVVFPPDEPFSSSVQEDADAPPSPPEVPPPPPPQTETPTTRDRELSLEAKEKQELAEIDALKSKLAPADQKLSQYSLVTSARIGVIVTVVSFFLCTTIMHVSLQVNSKRMSDVIDKGTTGGMTKYNFFFMMGLILNFVVACLLGAAAYFFVWHLDSQYYIDALQLSQSAAKDFQLCRGVRESAVPKSFHAVVRCGFQWRSLFERLAKSIAIASRKVESLNELVEMTEAEERQQVRQELPPFNVYNKLTPTTNSSQRHAEGEPRQNIKPSFRETGSFRRNQQEGLTSQVNSRALSRSEQVLADVENFDMSVDASPAGAQKDAVVSGEIGPMVVYIVCRLFLHDILEELSEMPDEGVAANLRQMSNTFSDAVTRIASSSGGVAVGIELDAAIITYNAFSPVPAVSVMNTAYKAAISLEQELTAQQKKLTCNDTLNVSWGMVLQHSRLLVDHGGTEYVKQPYVYSPELEFAFQVVELCRLLKCPILSMASSSQSNRTLQIVPVDVIGLETDHTMFLYELKSRTNSDNRLYEDKMIDGLLQIHTHKFDEAIETLKALKDSNHNAMRLYYLAWYLRKLVGEGADIPEPYFRAGPSWEFLEMLVMKQDYSKGLDALHASNMALTGENNAANTPVDVNRLSFGDQGEPHVEFGLNAEAGTEDAADFNERMSLLGPREGFGSFVEKTPVAFQPSPFPFTERDDAFADIEKLESCRIEDEMLSTRDAPPSSYSRRGSFSQSLNMNFKIPSLQSSIVVGSSTRLHMVSARKAQRAVVITGNEPISNTHADTPTRVLKFILGDLIAEGTGGREVYRGLHPNGRIVAIKKVPIAEHSIDLKAAERELETLARLKHPNILRYVASCYTDDVFYIIMEFVSGGSLTDFIRNFGALPKEAIRRYAMDSLSGLEYLHRRGIVHRDISTNNIMVTIDGECKIADFGGAFLYSESDSMDLSGNNSFGFQWSTTFLEMSSASVDSSMNISQIGHPKQASPTRPAGENVFGTPVYMSPQAAQGIVDPKNDIWTLGAFPSQEKDLTAPSKTFLDNLCNGSVRPVIPTGEIDRGLEKLITMCLQEELDDRPTASQLLKNPYILQGNSRKYDHIFNKEKITNVIHDDDDDAKVLTPGRERVLKLLEPSTICPIEIKIMSTPLSITPWLLRGTVIHGFGRGGSQLGFPTANVELSDDIVEKLLPFKETVLFGWGCVEAAHEQKGSEAHLGPYPFAMSVGTNPHFKNSKISVEPYFIHKFPDDFYGRVVRILAIGKIRDSIAFTTLEKLIETIKNDVTVAKQSLEHPQALEWKKSPLVDPYTSYAENALPSSFESNSLTVKKEKLLILYFFAWLFFFFFGLSICCSTFGAQRIHLPCVANSFFWMFRSVGEFTACCQQTFALFAQVETAFGDDGTEAVLSPYAAHCAFTTVTGHTMDTSHGVVLPLNERRFVDWMVAYMEADNTLVASPNRPFAEEGEPVSPTATPPQHLYVWSMFEALAGSKGYIAPEDLQVETSVLYEGIAESILNSDIPFAHHQRLGGEEHKHDIYHKPRSMSWNGTAAQHLFHLLDKDNSGRLTFSDVKDFLTIACLFVSITYFSSLVMLGKLFRLPRLNRQDNANSQAKKIVVFRMIKKKKPSRSQAKLKREAARLSIYARLKHSISKAVVLEPFLTPLHHINLVFRELNASLVSFQEAHNAVEAVTQQYVWGAPSQSSSEESHRICNASSRRAVESVLTASQLSMSQYEELQHTNHRSALLLDVLEELCVSRNLCLQRHYSATALDRKDMHYKKSVLLVVDMSDPSFASFFSLDNPANRDLPCSSRRKKISSFVQVICCAQHPSPWRVASARQIPPMRKGCKRPRDADENERNDECSDVCSLVSSVLSNDEEAPCADSEQYPLPPYGTTTLFARTAEFEDPLLRLPRSYTSKDQNVKWHVKLLGRLIPHTKMKDLLIKHGSNLQFIQVLALDALPSSEDKTYTLCKTIVVLRSYVYYDSHKSIPLATKNKNNNNNKKTTDKGRIDNWVAALWRLDDSSSTFLLADHISKLIWIEMLLLLFFFLYKKLENKVGGHTEDIFYGEPTSSGRKTVVKSTTGWEVLWYMALSLADFEPKNDIPSSHQWCASATGLEFINAVRPLRAFTAVAASFTAPDSTLLRSSCLYETLKSVLHPERKGIALQEKDDVPLVRQLFLALWTGMDNLSGFDDAYDKTIWSLRLEDATDGLIEPCVMDAKLGFLGYSPFTEEKKKVRIKNRTSALIRRTGIRVCGTHRYLDHTCDAVSDSKVSNDAAVDDNCTCADRERRHKEKLRKPIFYALQTEEELARCFQHFFLPYGPLGSYRDGVTFLNHAERKVGDDLPVRRAAAAASKTKKLLEFFVDTKEGNFLTTRMSFVSSSFLIIYDSAGAFSPPIILLIDFARCGLRRLNYSEAENGFLYGLGKFVDYLQCIANNYDSPDFSLLQHALLHERETMLGFWSDIDMMMDNASIYLFALFLSLFYFIS
eukprot:gene5336-3835_t